MSITETVLTFVVAPAAVVFVITALVYAGGGRRARRYRPGRPFEFTPVWFLSSPEQLSGVDSSAAALPAAAHRGELTSGPRHDEADQAGDARDEAARAGATPESHAGATPEVAHGATGGASDRW